MAQNNNTPWYEGQKVIVHSGYAQMYVATVTKVTPSGMAWVNGGLYLRDGFRRGYARESYRPWIQDADPKLLETLERQKVIQTARDLLRVVSLTYEQSVQIIKILKGETNENS